MLSGLLIAASPLPSRSPDPLADVERKVLYVEIQNAQGERGGCSAAVVAEGVALTAAHCVENADVIVAGRAARVALSNARLDVAVIAFPSRLEVPLALQTAPPAFGDGVIVAGYIWGELHVQPGYVSRPRNGGGHLVVAAPIISGDSGAPVLDLNGRMVGMMIAVRAKGAGYLGIAVPAEALADLIPKQRGG